MGDILRISNPVSVGIGAILLPPRQSLARSPLWRPIQRLNCVACRYLFRCLSASCFRRIRTAQSGQYFARLDLGVNAAPHTAHRFTLSRLWMISAYSAPSSGEQRHETTGTVGNRKCSGRTHIPRRRPAKGSSRHSSCSTHASASGPCGIEGNSFSVCS